MARLEAELAECEAELADPSVCTDPARLAELGRRQVRLRQALDQAEEALLALYAAS